MAALARESGLGRRSYSGVRAAGRGRLLEAGPLGAEEVLRRRAGPLLKVRTDGGYNSASSFSATIRDRALPIPNSAGGILADSPLGVNDVAFETGPSFAGRARTPYRHSTERGALESGAAQFSLCAPMGGVGRLETQEDRRRQKRFLLPAWLAP